MERENAYEGMTGEAKARLKGCETPEEIIALAQEEGYELSDSQLEGISGGWGDCGDYVDNPCTRHHYGE